LIASTLQTPYIPITKSHALFPVLRSCQRISPRPRHFETFRNKLNFYGEGLLAQPQAEGPPLVGCPRLFIQYIRSYHPYLECIATLLPAVQVSTYTKIFWAILWHMA
jgi:hypothetical protein